MPSQAKLAKIHIAKKELGLSDDAYRDILRLHFQVESAARLDDRQATVLINRFRAKGWVPKQATAPRGRRTASTARSPFIEVPPGPAADQQRKVLALWNELGYPMAKLHARVKKQFRVERFEWLQDGAALHVLITDLSRRVATAAASAAKQQRRRV